jgi:hypothetical protein
MIRSQLEHIIRAAGTISNCKSIVVIGSQAILGSIATAPDEIAISTEADVYPEEAPELSDLIDGCIGELSPFHEQFGYYAQGVGEDTAILPRQWRKRAVVLENENTNGYRGICLAPADIVISKLVAGREKDKIFVRSVIRNKIVTLQDVERLFPECNEEMQKLVMPRLDLWLKEDRI